MTRRTVRSTHRSTRPFRVSLHRCGLLVLSIISVGDAEERIPPHPDFRYVLNEDGIPQTAAEVVIPPALIDAVAEAEIALSLEEGSGLGAIVFRVVGSNQRPFQATVEIEYLTPGHIGILSKKIKAGDGDCFCTRYGMAYELRAFAPGYETLSRRFVLNRDQILVWNDLVLEPIPVRDGGFLEGRVAFEDGVIPQNLLISIDGDITAFADAGGRFFIDGLRNGRVTVAAQRPGFHGMEARVGVTRSQRSSCELFGFLERQARIRWTYQPDGSRGFGPGALTGTETIKHSPERGYGFGGRCLSGLHEGDYYVRQERDKLTLVVYVLPGQDSPGLAHLDEIGFDEVGEMPEVPLAAMDHELKPGFVFVLRCFDRQHFAKMEVLDVGTESELNRRKQ